MSCFALLFICYAIKFIAFYFYIVFYLRSHYILVLSKQFYTRPVLYVHNRPVASGGLGGALALPVFDQTVNPISTRGADYAHLSTSSLPGFSDLCDGPECKLMVRGGAPKDLISSVVHFMCVSGQLLDLQSTVDFRELLHRFMISRQIRIIFLIF